MGKVEDSNTMKRQSAWTGRFGSVGLAHSPWIVGAFDQAIVPAKSRRRFELACGDSDSTNGGPGKSTSPRRESKPF